MIQKESWGFPEYQLYLKKAAWVSTIIALISTV